MNARRTTGFRELYPELAVALVCVSVLCFLFRSLLLGKTLPLHDNYYWNFPLFHFLADNVLNGRIPLWNPFTHAGEPFYPILVQWRLLEPFTIGFIAIAQFLTHNTVILFNIDRILQSLLQGFGTFLLFRPFARHLTTRFSLILILCFSSFLLGSFRQDGILSQFSWTPFIAYFTFRILYYKDCRWFNWLLLAGFLGLRLQSYWFVGTAMFFLFLIFGLAMFRRDLIKSLLKTRTNWLKIATVFVIVAAMAGPDLVLWIQRDQFVFPLRTAQNFRPGASTSPIFESDNASQGEGIKLSYDSILSSGSFSSPWDFLQMLAPGNGNIEFLDAFDGSWGRPSEAYLYFGLIGWCMGLVGIFFVDHELKSIWLTLLGGFGLLMFGPMGGIHRLLFAIFPPTWFARHTHTFVMYFSLAFLFFFVQGMEKVLNWAQRPLERKTELNFRSKLRTVVLLVSVFFLGFISLGLNYPETNFLFALILVPVGLGWLLKERTSAFDRFAAVATALFLLVLLFHPHRLNFLGLFLCALVVPLLIVLKSPPNKKFFGLASVALLCALSTDLLLHFDQAWKLYDFAKSPEEGAHISTEIIKPQPPSDRVPYEYNLYSDSPAQQAMRYFSTLTKRSSALSETSSAEPPKNLDEALHSHRWVTMLMEKDYFKLIHSGLSAALLENIFGINRPAFQFRSGRKTLGDKIALRVLDSMNVNSANHFLAQSVLISGEDTSADLSPTTREANFTFKYDSYFYDALTITTNCDQEGWLYWSDGYDPDWSAKMDGKPVPLLKANFNFKAVALPSGKHQFTFEFRPTGFLWALAFFYSSFLVALTAGVISAWFRSPLAAKAETECANNYQWPEASVG